MSTSKFNFTVMNIKTWFRLLLTLEFREITVSIKEIFTTSASVYNSHIGNITRKHI